MNRPTIATLVCSNDAWLQTAIDANFPDRSLRPSPNCLAPDPPVALCALAAFERDAPVRALGVRARQPTGEPLAGAHKSAIPPVTIFVFEMPHPFAFSSRSLPSSVSGVSACCAFTSHSIAWLNALRCTRAAAMIFRVVSLSLTTLIRTVSVRRSILSRPGYSTLPSRLIRCIGTPSTHSRLAISGGVRTAAMGLLVRRHSILVYPYDLHFRRFVSQRRSGSGSQLLSRWTRRLRRVPVREVPVRSWRGSESGGELGTQPREKLPARTATGETRATPEFGKGEGGVAHHAAPVSESVGIVGPADNVEPAEVAKTRGAATARVGDSGLAALAVRPAFDLHGHGFWLCGQGFLL